MTDTSSAQIQVGSRVRTVDPLAYRRLGGQLMTAPVGLEGVVVEPDRDDPPGTFAILIDEPGKPQDMALICWVVAAQVEVI